MTTGEAPGRPPARSARLEHARRLLAVQAAVGVVIGVLLVGAVTLAVVLSRQDADLEQRLRAATAVPDPTDPPRGVWVVTVDADGRRTASYRTPDGFPTDGQLQTARSEGTPVTEEVEAGETEYLTRTELHDGTVVQAGVDFGPRDAERGRLLLGLGVAGTVAAGAAALVGLWLSRRAIAPLEEAMDRQRRFVADASHELRTPLTRLTLRAQMLQRSARAAGHPQDVEDASLLVAEARDMAAIVEDLLLSAQLEREPLHGEPVDVEQVAARVVLGDQPRAAERELELRAEISPVPPVRGVEVALTRALNALVDNALSHTPPGGHVVVGVEPGESGTVRLTVTDDGPGLDPETRQRVFERFARGHRDAGRFGLGLALVREVVESHGGSIGVDPAYTGGARFVVTLPAMPDERPA